ncbi:hypothetical protein [Dyadobacter frigoris]|uniref:hypothetical protein n=1 Tax=Dyadobacter frigoris TaxID=2576211 RepID=UPI0015F2D460|nr:hypothetical protein [Dyadobacter frigoris]GLU54892.1 hypothetical protein Dfri01_43530 [Dyadobacter frigoris]
MKTNSLSESRLAALGKFLLIGLVLVIPGYFFLYPQVLQCQIIGLSNFEKVNDYIYSSPSLEQNRRKNILGVIQKAEMRIDSFWLGKQAKPKLIICETPQEYQKYCQSTEGAGCSLGTPWGQSYVILNAQGLNVDVISHEMSHVELLGRLGWWKTTMDIPQWFNEGTALMLDRRFVNNPDSFGRYFDYMDEWLYQTGGGQNILELKSIASVKGFFNGGPKEVMLAYMSSGLEISYWLAYCGQTGLVKLVSDMKSGKSFAESYRDQENKAKQKDKLKLPDNPLRLPDSVKMDE